MTMRPCEPRMPRRPLGRLAVAVLLLAATGCAAHRAFRSAEDEERAKHWDLAVLAYQKAAELDPTNLHYKVALTQAKTQAALSHYDRGRLYRASGNLDLALVEFEQAVAIDQTIAVAGQELKKVKADIEARQVEVDGGTPVEKAKSKARGARAAAPLLNPSSTKPIDLIFPTETPVKKIYSYLGTAAGINIIFDPQLKDDKFSLDLRNVTFQKGLETVLRQAGHFYKVLDEKTMIVAQDNTQNRKEYEDLVIRTFFLSNGDVKDVSAMIRSILDLRRLGTIPQLNAIVIRDTADKVAVAERIIEINDKATSEVLIDVELVVMNTTKALELGTKLSSYSTTASLTSMAGSTSGGSLPWDQIFKLSMSDFSFTIPTVTFNFLKTNSDAEVIAKPQLRIAEGAKAQLIIGDKVPIPMTTINTQTAIGGTGVVPITSFQYQDIGIKIDIEPRVHHNKEVTLKLTVEASNQNGYVVTSSGNQPIIGTRTITSTIRLKDGETNVLAGLIRNDRTKTKTTIPFLGDLPLIGALFTNYRDDNSRTDLLMTLTPHIVRSPSITEEDLIPVWVGTENNVSFSGSSTRLESPSAPGSPFDPVPETPVPGRAPAGAVAPVPGGTASPMPRMAPVPGGSRKGAALPGGSGGSSLNAVPEAPEAQPAAAAVANASAVAAERSVSLTLDPSAPSVAVGGSMSVSIIGSGGLSDLNALELTVEWDPALAEVTGISPGPWAKSLPPGSVRFEADRVPGRARLVWNRAGAGIGLPEGVLAGFAVKGTGEGRSVFRVTAGSALGRNGPVRPLAVPAAIRIGEPEIPKA